MLCILKKKGWNWTKEIGQNNLAALRLRCRTARHPQAALVPRLHAVIHDFAAPRLSRLRAFP